MRVYIFMVDEILADQHVDHAESERGIGARAQRDMLMALFRRERLVGIDRDQLCAATLRFLRARPEMQARRDRIRSPDQDQFALFVKLRMHAEAGAVRVAQASRTRGGANGALES